MSPLFSFFFRRVPDDLFFFFFIYNFAALQLTLSVGAVKFIYFPLL